MSKPAVWEILDRGPLVEIDGPERDPDDRATRLQDLLSLLAGLNEVVRPLALEVQFATYDEYGLPKSMGGNVWVSVNPLPTGVALHSYTSHASPPLDVPRIGPAQAQRALCPAVPGEEWHHVRFLVTAARVISAEIQGASLDGLPSRPVPMIDLDGHIWAVGPVAFFAMQRYLPVTLEVEQIGFALRARIEARWSPWFDENKDECKALKKAIDELRGRGFCPHSIE